MGGNALKMTTRRCDKNEYQELVEDITNKLTENNITFWITKSFEDKQSFGDMDILIKGQINMELLRYIFNPSETKTNDKCVSLDYKRFQIDLIHFSDEDYETAKVYYSYNDLHNLIGVIASSKFNLKWGWDGLKKKYKNRNVFIAKNYKEALDLLGFDVERYDKGFKSLDEIFDFVCRSKYFNKSAFQLERLSSRARDRSKKRTNYVLFLNYIDFNYEKILSEMYPNIQKRIEEIDEEEKEFIRRRNLINGHIILEIDPNIDKMKMGPILHSMRGDEETFKRTREENLEIFFNIYNTK